MKPRRPYVDPWQRSDLDLGPRCVECLTPRDPDELLDVAVVRTGASFLVCRPALFKGECFRARTGSVNVHRISQAAGPGVDRLRATVAVERRRLRDDAA